MTQEFADILKQFDRTYAVEGIAGSYGDARTVFTGLHGSSRALFAAALFNHLERGLIVVTSNNRSGANLYSDLGHFVSSEQLYLFPAKETLPYDSSEPYRELTTKRIVALDALNRGERGIFVLPVRSFTDLYIPKEQYNKQIIHMRVNMNIDMRQLQEQLIMLGYDREEKVSVQGSFAVRGGIVDIYVSGQEHPCRLEFFDDVLESLRTFSPSTQRSLHTMESCTVLPAKEVFVSPSARSRILKNKNRENAWVVDTIIEGESLKGIENYLSLLYDSPDTVLDYGEHAYHLLFDSLEGCREVAEFFHSEASRIYDEQFEKRYLLAPDQVSADFNDMVEGLKGYGTMSSLPGLEKEVVDFAVEEKRTYLGQIKSFKDELERFLQKGYRIILGASYEGQTNRLREMFRDVLQTDELLSIVTCDLNEGFVSHKQRLAIILDREIFNRKRRYASRFLEAKTRPLEGTIDIKDGEYVVHMDHGIGIFRGIEKLHTGGAEKDFLKLEYRDGDEIYIPVDQINLVHRYVGHEGRKPRIDRIGSGTWKKVKEHVKRSVRNMAKDLIELYSVRASLQGHAFAPDTEWQYEFESGFRYEETEDQLRTIEEIKRDMERPQPMDRLICGDVGFGKTEVAIRAAFKAVMDGKQVAILVPTTVLAEQHLGTFTDRFTLFPITVEMLSRFRSPAEQRQIVKNLKEGLIDVVIGTHRLIQKDIEFRDLGLVIIDEEQRFGVEHKEKLKQLRKLVDVITMTATPIPRTLYMSMTTIRDMSIIETPPRDRIPIETYVIEYDEHILMQAIRREVERGGQVYYVHNRVRTIDEKAEILRSILPGVSIEVAHGQMEERELEDVMQGFFNQEFQVLVTTTIIESGLDIPNVNTIIIERADRFGLSQLYQLRGRVGRSKRKAYAYLLHPSGMVITEQAQKRLTVINDHTELGSGYSIALKDLEIRGAGNLLGREQHGDMLAVGFEMYVKLLDEAIRELQGTDQAMDIDPVLDLRYRGFIPTSYIDSEKLRVEMYKRLSAVQDDAELDDLREEMHDRFGAIPDELNELFVIVRLRTLCRNTGIRLFREKENELQLVFEKSRVDIIGLLQKVHENRRIFSISPRDHNTLHIYRVFKDNAEKFDFMKELFEHDQSA
jgi:transcription-repair coupling factor (superfamily II helicase)